MTTYFVFRDIVKAMKCIDIELIELDSGAVQKVRYHLRSRATINGLITCKIKLFKTEEIDAPESIL